MPFLGRTDYGGPFNAYYEALSNLGSEFVRYAPWFPNPVSAPRRPRSPTRPAAAPGARASDAPQLSPCTPF